MRNIKISKIFSENATQIVSLLVLISSLIIIDQVTKALAQKYLEHSASIEIIPNLISLHFIRNEITYVHQYIFYFMLCLVVFPIIIIRLFSSGHLFERIFNSRGSAFYFHKCAHSEIGKIHCNTELAVQHIHCSV